MAPASSKRKRPERQASEDQSSHRPSPYKPEKSGSARRTSRGDAIVQKDQGTPEQHAGDGTNGTPHAGRPSSRDGAQTPALATDQNSDKASRKAVNGDAAQASLEAQRQPYHYAYITDEIASTWSEAGQATLLDSASALDEVQLADVFEEFSHSVLDGRLSAQHAGLAAKDIIAARVEDISDVDSLLLDTVGSLYDTGHKIAALGPMLAASGIDQQAMREQLEVGVLMEVGLVRSTFERMRTRKTTNLLYRQANFNLCREESEGYAKLITEIFNIATEASGPREAAPFIAEDASQRVQALIGAFDLDVGRVLDITLDISANLLVRAYPFIMKFYGASSWWPSNDALDGVKWQDEEFCGLPEWALPGSGQWGPKEEESHRISEALVSRDARFWDRVKASGIEAFFEQRSRKITNIDSVRPLLDEDIAPEYDSRGKETNPEKRLRLNQDREFMRKTGTLPPSGNYDAAQLLGFKLRFYSSPARDADEVTPDNLIFLTALLIKIGFISLRDMYPHLHPSDTDMGTEKRRLEQEKSDKELKDRPNAGVNALLSVSALVDPDAPTLPRRNIEKEKSGAATPAQEKKEESKKEVPPSPRNQKILLLKALLLIGALPEALFILGRFPWLMDVDVSLPPFLHRIMTHMMQKMTESLRPLGSHGGVQASTEQLVDTTARVDGTLLFTTKPNKRTTKHLWADGHDDKSDGVEFRHFYNYWNDNIPICQTVDDVFQLCNTFAGYLGARIGQNVTVYGTLLRLAHRDLTEDSSEQNRKRWLELITRLLAPALSWTKHNTALAQLLFDILKLFPTATRYAIYYDWFKGRCTRRDDMRSVLALNKYEVRDVLRRISNDYVKKQSRALAKIAVGSPGIVMMEMISQLENYSNMIPSLVECTRYFCPLAWDILIWALIDSLSGQGRNRMQSDGMLTSSWLQALSQFVATLFSHHSQISVAPILQYLASELRVGNSTDLELLEQLLVEMAGIRSDMDFNESQVLAMGGGKLLRAHVLSQLSDARHEKQRPAKRLMEALGQHDLTGQILVAIAQERQMYPCHETSRDMPLKVLGNNVDKVNAIFLQYLEVLKANLSLTNFEQAVPGVISLTKDFGLEPSIAFTICRTIIRGRMNELDEAKKEEAKREAAGHDQPEANGDMVMKDREVDIKAETNPSGSAGAEVDAETSEVDLQADTDDAGTSPWHPILEPIVQSLSEVQPELAGRISIPFYVTFWTLDLPDVLVPMDVYESSKRRLEAQIAEITNDRKDLSAISNKMRESKKKGLTELRNKLSQEPTHHLSDYIAVRNRINKLEKLHYFPKSETKDPREAKAEIDAKHQALLQECFLPRAMMSAPDAQFSFQMLKMLHDNGTPGFSLMHLLNQLFKKHELTALIFQCTLNEAQHLGRFLNEVLKYLQSWHADKAVYEKEALGSKQKLPGFVKTFDEKGEPKLVMDYENFRRMLYNFHAYLNGALQACFESDEYMHIRNGIVVLKAIHQVFPALKFIGKNMVDHVTKLSKEEPRADLKLAAMSLMGPLKSREKQWLLPQAFRLNDMSKEAAKPASRPPSALPETPGADASKLNAAAPDFKPNATSAPNSAGRKESVAGAPEDGEIEDEKTTNAKVPEKKTTPASKRVQDAAKLPDKEKEKQKTEVKPSQPTPSKDATKSESKPSTPAPSHARPPPSGPHRGDLIRPSSTQPGSGSSSARRTPQDLPSRPEPPKQMPLPASRSSGRFPSRADDQYGRLDRPNETRPSSRDQSPGHRSRGRTPPTTTPRHHQREERPYERPSDRPSYDSRGPRDDGYTSSRREPPPQHQGRPSSDLRDRPAPVSTVSEGHLHPDRQNRIESVVVPSENQQAAKPASGSATPAQQQEDQAHVNPARLAMINTDSTPNDPGARRGRDFAHPADREPSRRERESRPDDRGPPGFPPRQSGVDSRRAGGRPLESPREAQSRAEQPNELAPTGPRHGRLSRESHEESSYGRLNGPPEPPSGPRQPNGPNGRGPRNFTAPLNTRVNEQLAPSPTTSRPPDSPASFRGPPRLSNVSGPTNERNSTSSSTPTTPAADPPVHPSRAAQFNAPAPIQTALPTPNGPRNAGSPTSAPPSGPRNGVPPSGPAAGNDRQRRTDKQRQSINATIANGANTTVPNGQGVNFRGASSRQPSGTFPSSGPRSSVPSVASAMNPPQARPDARAPEEQSAGPANTRPDLFRSRSDRPDDNGRRRDESRPDGPRGSRDPSRERRGENAEPSFPVPPPPPGPPPSGPGDMRDRRARDDRRPREDRPRENQSRDMMQQSRDARGPPPPPPDMPGSGYGPQAPNWDRGNGARRDAQNDMRGSSRSGAPGRPEEFGGSRREDSRRDAGGRAPRAEGGEPTDGGRKRRQHEDGQANDPNKRRRSGR